MRWTPIAIAAVLAACTTSTTSPPPQPTPGHGNTGAALVFAPLEWTLSESEVNERLAAANMAPQSDEIRAYFAPEPTAPGEPQEPISHTSEPVVIFHPKPGWTGQARFGSVGGSLASIEIRAQLTATAARHELEHFQKTYGPPTETRTLEDGATRKVWIRGGVWLIAIAGRDGSLWVEFRRDDRPASAIGP
jgi:hypothetical protein